MINSNYCFRKNILNKILIGLKPINLKRKLVKQKGQLIIIE